MTDNTEHKPGCEALGGYGHGIGPCCCSAAQNEALAVAEELDSTRNAFGDDNAQSKRRAAAELRRQHAEIQQLKAQLSARQAAPDGLLALEQDAHSIFNDPPSCTSQEVRDVIEWYAASVRVALSAAPRTPEREPLLPDFPVAKRRSQSCWCETCRPNTLSDMRFIVCPDCGNKRCPKATHHDNACTNSNAPGQPGSSWEHVKPHGATNDNP